MPSVGRIKLVSVAALAAAVLGVAASSASAANPVWLWACHDRTGTALPELGSQAVPELADKSCVADDPSLNTWEDGLRTALSDGRTKSTWRIDVPPHLDLAELRIHRRTTQLGEGQRYELATSTGVLESREAGDTPFNGLQTFTPSGEATDLGDWVRFGVSCTSPCTQPEGGVAGADVSAIGLRVEDTTLPNFAVGGTRSPASGTLNLSVQATDTGSGLRSATAQLGPAVVSRDFAGNDDCRDLTPGTAVVDMSINADCPTVDSVTLGLETHGLADGDYTLTITVVDWAGNARSTSQPVTVLNTLPVNTPTQTLSIGTAGILTPPAAEQSSPPSGGVAGASAQQCRSPRLSVFLAQKPLRVVRRIPVLKAGKRYRFNGRLTCVINGRRRSAPKRTRIDILNQIRRNRRTRTIEKAGTTIRNKGRLTVILAYKTSRVIIFRFTNSDGQRAQVRIRVRVARR